MGRKPKTEVRFPVLNPEAYRDARLVAPGYYAYYLSRNGRIGGWRPWHQNWRFWATLSWDSAKDAPIEPQSLILLYAFAGKTGWMSHNRNSSPVSGARPEPARKRQMARQRLLRYCPS